MVYDYYGGAERFPSISPELMRAVDQADSAQYSLIDEILELPDVKERVELYHEQAEAFVAQLRRCSTIRGSVVVVDLRAEELIHAGNRFMVYALFPASTVSVHVIWGKRRQNTVLAVGKSILNRTSGADIGALMLSYGGGGHANAGTCQVAHEEADRIVEELVGHLNAASSARV